MLWQWLERLGLVVGVCGIIGVGFYALNIEWRLRMLEAQALTFSVSPTADGTGRFEGADPIALACAEVSNKLIEATEPVGFGPAVDAYKEQLSLLGCTNR